ncbi:type IV pilus secretin PilQ [Spiribacter insolitus]|uniref:Type IV pilus secretin PilQ n=1 Tax=Spiribacter insolitus TaxID=3122417 RepID=A0ABV3T7L0_9GAMM
MPAVTNRLRHRIAALILMLGAMAAHAAADPPAPVRLDIRDMTLPEVMNQVRAVTGENPSVLQNDGQSDRPLPADTDEPGLLPTVFLPVKYATAADLADLIQAPRVRVDSRTNTLIVGGTQSDLERARALVERLDVPVRQVLIEARLVIASEDFSDEIGVQFRASRRNQAGDSVIISGGTLDEEGLMVDLPVGNAAGSAGLAIGKVGSYLLQLELSAMESENRGEIISSPRVVTASNQQAEIKQGVQIPFEQATSSGATSIAFRDAVLGLTVTPQITPDDQIQLALAVNQDSRGEETPEGPAINTQSVRTHVLVADGETVVLGGVFEQTRRNGVRRVPLLSDLPVVGGLFERRMRVDDRSELLIFVTPRILEAPTAITNTVESGG